MSQRTRGWSRIGVVGLLVAFAACADQMPMAPSTSVLETPAAPSMDGTVETSTAAPTYPLLTRNVPLDRDLWSFGWIYPSNNYQSLKIQEAGVKVSFSPGAVKAPLFVVILAHKGPYVSYEFYPHGTTFDADVKIQQDLHGTNAYHNEAVMSSMLAGYMDDGRADINYTDGTVSYAETFPIYYWDNTTDFKKTTPSVAKFYTRHFSGYSLASGRSGMTDLYGGM